MVVIAIISVLACILVPKMYNYILEAKIARANANAKLMYTYASDYLVKCEIEGTRVSMKGPRAQAMTAYNGADILYDGTQTDFFNFLQRKMDSKETNSSKAQYVVAYFNTHDDNTSGYIVDITWTSKRKDQIVGSYPFPAVGKATKKYGTFYYFPNVGDLDGDGNDDKMTDYVNKYHKSN